MPILTNARVVTRHETFLGTIVWDDGTIRSVDRGVTANPAAEDLGGGYVLPGLVEIHTDNLERHLQPRSTRWPATGALFAHDAQVAATGITTVLDAICIGIEHDIHGQSRDYLADSLRAWGAVQGRLRAEHYFHFRCELPHPALPADFEAVAEHPALRLVSLMDHTPGQRQTADLVQLRRSMEKMGRVSDEWFAATVAAEQEKQSRFAAVNRRALVAIARERNIPLASHDDATLDHVAEARAEGITIAEFPTTLTAATAAREAGMTVFMGAPNVVLGGSQSGNLSVLEAVRAGAVDALSSDYAPVSLLDAVFRLARQAEVALPEAVAMISSIPAQVVGFPDRGELRAGLRADLVEVGETEGTPHAIRVWRQGVRVA